MQTDYSWDKPADAYIELYIGEEKKSDLGLG
jgi:hypothetical protein